MHKYYLRKSKEKTSHIRPNKQKKERENSLSFTFYCNKILLNNNLYGLSTQCYNVHTLIEHDILITIHIHLF